MNRGAQPPSYTRQSQCLILVCELLSIAVQVRQPCIIAGAGCSVRNRRTPVGDGTACPAISRRDPICSVQVRFADIPRLSRSKPLVAVNTAIEIEPIGQVIAEYRGDNSVAS